MANISQIAEALIGLSQKEVLELSRILAEEYSIVCKEEKPEQAVAVKFPKKDDFLPDEALKVLRIAEKTRRKGNTQMWYIPKKIGKPCKAPSLRRK